MKTFHFIQTLLISVAITGTINAQSPQYFKAMKENLQNYSRAKTPDSLQAVEAQFERIAQAEKDKWIPYYYAAQILVIESFSTKPELKDHILDQAQTMLDAAFNAKADSSECMVIQGFIYVGRIQADPMNRGAEFSQKANNTFDLAIKLNPENPRAYYMKGITVLNTPEFFGGGKINAKPILTQAIAKYSTFSSSYPFFPNWGKEDCKKQLERCN
jgi:hypothetical protein